MKTSEIGKVYPFCDRSSPESAVRKKMGIVHLGLNPEDCQNESNEVTAVTQTRVETETKNSETKSENEMFECGQCDQAFPTEDGLQEHFEASHFDVKIHTENIEEELEQKCLQSTLTSRKRGRPSEKTTPVPRKRGRPSKAEIERRAIDKSEIEAILREEIKTRQPVIILERLTSHKIARYINELRKKSQCNNCSKQFCDMWYMEKHKVNCILKEKYICEHCRKTFNRKDSLRRHVENHHLKIKNFSCSHCGKAFTQKSHLKVHILSVHEGVQYTCETCHKTFNHQNSLKRHVEADHLNIKNFLCSDCGKAFAEKVKLQVHSLSVHKKIRFDCNMCDKTFANKAHLRTHVKVIHEEGIIANLKKCSKCSYSSTKKANLKRHILEVHESQKEKCDFCQKYFVRSALSRHIKRKHL